MKRPLLWAAGLCLALTLSGCEGDRTYGPSYVFVQDDNQKWIFVGVIDHGGYPNGESSTRLTPWLQGRPGSSTEIRGCVVPTGAKNWPPSKAKLEVTP